MIQPAYGTGGSMKSMRQYIKAEFGEPSQNGGYGTGLKKDIRRLYGPTLGMAGRGESVPRHENYCEIDPNVVDKYGIPVLRFNYNWTDQEILQAKHMHETFEEILTGAGAILGSKPGPETNYGLLDPGKIIREVGTTRMGKSAKGSVVNSNCQTHDCKNLFVVDAGFFCITGG